MNNESPVKALIVVTVTALVCSVIVTVAAVTLRPMQKVYEDLERSRAIIGISGLTDDVGKLSDREVAALFQQLDAKIVNLDTGEFDNQYDPDTFDTWKAADDPESSTAIPQQQDFAKIARRSQLVTVYLAYSGTRLERMVLPVYGQGMWSTLYGFIALRPDLNTIAGITFFEQAETAGIGDRILDPDWQASWRGRKLYDESGVLQLRVAGVSDHPVTPPAAYQIDAITGATVTVDAVANLVRYWFGSHGYALFLETFPPELER